MQYINLLPEDMRPKAKTPARVIASIYVGVAVSFSFVMWALYLQVGVIPEKQSRINTLKSQISTLAGGVKDHDRLQASIKEMVRRDSIVTELRNKRVKWGRKLDLMWDVVSGSRSTWIRELTVVESKIKKRISARKSVDIVMPTLFLKLRSGNFEKKPSILEINSEKIITDFIDSYAANEDLMKGFELLPPDKWKFVDEDFKKNQRLYVDYELKMRALPYDKDFGRKKQK